MGCERFVCVVFAGALIAGCAGGGGGGVAGGGITPPGVPTTQTSSASPTSEGTTSPSSVALGGYTGVDTTYRRHKSGDVYEYSEAVALTYSQSVQNDFAYTIAGSDGSTPPSSLYWLALGKTAAIEVRKVPGVVYTIHVTKPFAYAATFTTDAKPAVPNPALSTLNEPYRYGVLADPFPGSLGSMTCSSAGGSSGTCALAAVSSQQVQWLCDAHVRFVRIEYVAGQILDNDASFYAQPNFLSEDTIMDQLAKCGITELPVILQYAAGNVMTDNQSASLPMQYSSSTDPSDTKKIPGYADFAKIVVEHLKAKYSKITRVELFNEPNLPGWGTFPVDGDYSKTDQTGVEAAVYMKAAYAAIKSVDPAITVVGPALSDGGGGVVDPRTFLKAMLGNGCKPGTCFDVISVHNYDWENPALPKLPEDPNRWSIYQTLQEILDQYGHPGVHAMITEWGFSTIDQSDGFDPNVQAEYIALGFNLMLHDPTLDGIVYVNMYGSGTDFWSETSLINQDGTFKPGYQVFKTFASF